MRGDLAGQERVDFWDSFPERELFQLDGKLCRKDVIRYMARNMGKPRVLEIGVDFGDVLRYCDDVFGSYMGVDVSYNKLVMPDRDMCSMTLLKTDSQTFWRTLSPKHEWDIIFVDGDHSLLGAYLDVTQAMFRVSDKGYVLSHDTAPSTLDGNDDSSAGWAHNRLSNLRGWYARTLEGHPEGLSIYFKK